jgi:hypothetical protein
LDPRPLGHEPYDVRLSRLKASLAGPVTLEDKTDPISLRRLHLPRLVLSRRVRFTNWFTEQAIDLRVPAPSSHLDGRHSSGRRGDRLLVLALAQARSASTATAGANRAAATAPGLETTSAIKQLSASADSGHPNFHPELASHQGYQGLRRYVQRVKAMLDAGLRSLLGHPGSGSVQDGCYKTQLHIRVGSCLDQIPGS